MVSSIYIYLLLCIVAGALSQTCPGVGGKFNATSITQYGVKFTFDKSYTCGQFANGDYWVVGPVKITAISPNFDTTYKLNGFELNPASHTETGLDGRLPFNAALVPALPLTVSGIATILKAVSVSKDVVVVANTPMMQTAVALTVLTSIPVNDGKTTFRPSYFGPASFKQLISTTTIQFAKSPKITPPASVTAIPSMNGVMNDFKRIWVDHNDQWISINYHPIDNMPLYGADVALATHEAALRLLLSDVQTHPNGTCAMINYLQYGIDVWGLLAGGNTWQANGGHMAGRKLPLVFAGAFLGAPHNASIYSLLAQKVQNINTFAEDSQVFIGKNGVVLWGQDYYCDPPRYWDLVAQHQTNSACWDPYGYVDGTGDDDYQFCCTTMPFKAATVPLNVMPELNQHWGNTMMQDYVYRWVAMGTWTKPDPCAPYDGNTAHYGITYGDDGNGNCIQGSGRFPQLHGTNADGGYYRSQFADQMYPIYVAPFHPVTTTTTTAKAATTTTTTAKATTTTTTGKAATTTTTTTGKAATTTTTTTAKAATTTTTTAKASSSTSTTGSTTSGPASQKLYTETTSPALDSDNGAVNLGLKFSTTVAGRVTGVQFYRGAGVSVSRVALWSSSGASLASLTVSPASSTSAGWVNVLFTSPVSISANTQYTVSYLTPAGHYAAINHGFDVARTVGNIVAPIGAGVYKYSSSNSWPTSAFENSEYFVSPIFVSP